jgi:phosphatidate cytidylyltransferase
MLWQRVLTALVGGTVLLYLIYIGGTPLSVAAAALALAAAFELIKLLENAGIEVDAVLLYPAAVLLPAAAVHIGLQGLLIALLVVFLAAVFLMVVRSIGGGSHGYEVPLQRIVWTVVGAAYVPILWSMIPLLREAGLAWILLAVLITWATDTMAYFTGLAFQGPKLAPGLSPKKTWSGMCGGTAAGAVASVGVNVWFSILSPGTALLVGITASVAAQAGDLWISLLKRYSSIDDSGAILPGHGGILDRFDSFSFVSIVVMLVVHFTGAASF